MWYFCLLLLNSFYFIKAFNEYSPFILVGYSVSPSIFMGYFHSIGCVVVFNEPRGPPAIRGYDEYLKLITRIMSSVKLTYNQDMFDWHALLSSIFHLTLIHLLLDKMAAIVTDDILNAFSWMKNDRIPLQTSLKFVHRSLICKKAALVQVKAWRWIGDNPLPEPVMDQFTDAYMRD